MMLDDTMGPVNIDENKLRHAMENFQHPDLETLPIVRQLRETLDNVTAERDVLLILLKHYAGCWECEFRDKGECVMPFFKDDCNEWAWRGKQEGPTQ